jgi:transcription antitermination factor NusG
MSYWAVAQTVSKMEHLVRREIEKTNRGAFLPTCARFWKVDGRDYAVERPVFGGYVFFLTDGEDWAGLPDIHGVYDVLAYTNQSAKRKAKGVSDIEMARMVIGHAAGQHNETAAPRYTKYFRGERPKPKRKNSRKPRPGNRLRNYSVP